MLVPRRHRVEGALRLLVVAIALVVPSSSCGDDDGVQGVVDVLTALKYEVSVLTLNIQGVREDWFGTVLPWRERYGRLATWAGDTKPRPPDLVVLEEVWFHHRDFGGGLNPHDYETLFELVERLNERTGAHYRIAYGSSTLTRLGLDYLFAGQAVLYNADRLRNTTQETLGASEVPVTWADATEVDVHMRQSHPCAEPVPAQLPLCSLVDGDGYLTDAFTNSQGRWDLVTTASTFAFRDDPDVELLVQNVHNNFHDFDHSWTSVRDLLTEALSRASGRVLAYPPLLVGDFNIKLAEMQDETGSGARLEDFEIAGYVGSDVIGVLVGKQGTHSSRFTPRASALALPREEKWDDLCAPVDVLWSDHCGLYVSVRPPVRSNTPG